MTDSFVNSPSSYTFPPITDLVLPSRNAAEIPIASMTLPHVLEEILAGNGIWTNVIHSFCGPAVTRLELEPEEGSKLDNREYLEQILARELSVSAVRIEPPYPGNRLFAIEVPNPQMTPVTLREILESEPMRNTKQPLTVALGRDTANTPLIYDLADNPFLLITGQSGSGKSICIHSMLNSLLFRSRPEDVKLILIDPAGFELKRYGGIPHLLVPVLGNPYESAAALVWATDEMRRRIELFNSRSASCLESYNQLMRQTGESPLPRIVIVIDELMDLLLVCGSNETAVIEQLLRLSGAAGIHLVISTRYHNEPAAARLFSPVSPARIAFRMKGAGNDAGIIDKYAERLLGFGDMMFENHGFFPIRVQGCFISDSEIGRVVKHVKSANPDACDPVVLEKIKALAGKIGPAE